MKHFEGLKYSLRESVEISIVQYFIVSKSNMKSAIAPDDGIKEINDEEICIETTLNEITESLCGSKDMNVVEEAVRMIVSKVSHENEHCEVGSMRSAISSHRHNESQEDEDQDSGPSEVPPALPLIEPLSSREISHDSIHMMCSRHVSRENLGLHTQNIDCGLQVTEEEIAREMGREHPLSALSHANMSVISSFNAVGVGDAFSDCFIGEHTRNQFDQLAQLRELYTSQLAMAEVTPNYKINHAGSVYSEPAFRLMSGPGSVCSEPPYRAPSPRCKDCRQSMTLSRTPSQSSLPSLSCFITNKMDQYASLRHPDGASDPNIEQKTEKITSNIDSKIAELLNQPPKIELIDHKIISTHIKPPIASQSQIPQLPPLKNPFTCTQPDTEGEISDF